MTDSNTDVGGVSLLPCPFCGGAMEEVTDEDGHYWIHRGRKGMERADCWLSDAWVSDQPNGEGSIGEWNTRSTPVRCDGPVAAKCEECGKPAGSDGDKCFGCFVYNREQEEATPPARSDAGSVDAWIEREFAGYGLAMRRKEDPPIPGEPLMSMATAKELTRAAVAAFSALASPPPSEVREALEWDANSNRNYEPVELRAAKIYERLDYDGPGKKPEWYPHGNSLKQDEARHRARELLRKAGHKPTLSQFTATDEADQSTGALSDLTATTRVKSHDRR